MNPSQKPELKQSFEIRSQNSKQTESFSLKRKIWSLEQNILYSRFLKLYVQKFSVNDGDKRFRKYKKMSVFLISKTPKQCRTHHQKMMIKFGKVEKIITQFSIVKIDRNQQKKTAINIEQKNSFSTISQIPDLIDDLEKPQKQIPSDSNEMIFDILF